MESKQSQEMSETEQKQGRDYDMFRQNLAREIKQLQEKQTKDQERRVGTYSLKSCSQLNASLE